MTARLKLERITVQTIGGTKEIEAELVNQFFAIHMSLDPMYYYAVTHIPSGRVIRSMVPKAGARIIAKRLVKLPIDWAEVRESGDPQLNENAKALAEAMSLL